MTQLLGVSQLEQARISQLSFVTAQENQTPDNTSTPRASILNSVSAQGIPDHAGDTPTRNSIRSFSAARHISYFSEDFSDESALRPSIHDSASSGQTATHIPSSSNTYSNGTEDIEAQSDKEEESTYTDITTPTSTTSPPPSSEIHFRSMTWLQCSALMIAETISLGILALPSVLATIGLIPGLLLILSMGILAWYSGIGTAVLITMISVGIRSPPSKPYTLWPRAHLSLREAFLSITNIVFAYAGHVAFFTFMSELREPDDFPKSLATLQIVEISLYLVSAIVIYVYAGSTVTSPALGSAGPVVSKIAFGVAIPTIVIAGVIFGHVASKYVFNKIFAGSPHINTRTKMSTMSWMGITLLLWIVAWVIAESIPVFNELLGLVSSLFASWFTV
ncbi:hypothetical protein OCU04_003873 [Sclerotinia nivalis]|uniref:Amino acid transporter transmembrane domain-containing protein n=1 Tax=Sclerotinia nivalis TaxID=352851 RepID=A0A9X0DN56_9HELO|nr:hypothetical protein OCU04_003873 [Sclerotinia nivalis]